MPAQLSALDPLVRGWLSLLDQAPERVAAVERWTARPEAFLDVRPGCLEETHAVPTLELCLAGSLRVESPGRYRDLAQGQALIIPPMLWHRIAPLRSGTLRLNLGFIAEGTLLHLQTADQAWSATAPTQPCRRLMDAAMAVPEGRALRLAVAGLLAALRSESLRPFHYPQPLWRMVEMLWNRTRHGLTVEQMLAASGLSRTQAYRLFTAGYGVPPKAALTACRLQLAEGLLAAGLGVGEAAARSGFPHPDALRRARRGR